MLINGCFFWFPSKVVGGMWYWWKYIPLKEQFSSQKKNNQLLYVEFFPFIFHLYTTSLYYVKKVYTIEKTNQQRTSSFLQTFPHFTARLLCWCDKLHLSCHAFLRRWWLIHPGDLAMTYWLVLETTHLKNSWQLGNLPQFSGWNQKALKTPSRSRRRHLAQCWVK